MKSAIKTLFDAIAGVNRSVQVYQGLAPGKATLPYVVLSVAKSEYVNQTEGNYILNLDMTLKCYAATQAATLDLSDGYARMLRRSSAVADGDRCRCFGLYPRQTGISVDQAKDDNGNPVWMCSLTLAASFELSD